MPHTAQMTTLSKDMRACIDNCLQCFAACEETKAHCIELGRRHVDSQHLTSLADCAVLCSTSANLMLRMSPLHARACGLCADACDRCRESCERVDSNDDTMRRCIDLCERCADSCRRMAA